MDRTKQEQEFFEWAEQLTEQLNNRKEPLPKFKKSEPPPLLKTEEDTF